MSAAYTSFITKTLYAFVSHTSPYYPQGNAINESSHQTLSKSLKARMQSGSTYGTSFEAIQSSIQDSPFARLLGKDPALPGLQEYDSRILEKLRVSEVQTPSTTTVPPQLFKIGDVVVYPRSRSPL
eukprot:GHVH01014966.1.p1 GENE.GHVH01014966.1~~GHVH01014966.1.p1  ORF type:complete len:126 (+),score=2.17 GHVH01014966.1:129-506(+)